MPAHIAGISGTIAGMSISSARVSEMILEQVSTREMRLLSLVVAVRKGVAANEVVKGDLTAAVKASLRRLVAAKEVVDVEGVYARGRGAMT
jgi:hypothetical protein